MSRWLVCLALVVGLAACSPKPATSTPTWTAPAATVMASASSTWTLVVTTTHTPLPPSSTPAYPIHTSPPALITPSVLPPPTVIAPTAITTPDLPSPTLTAMTATPSAPAAQPSSTSASATPEPPLPTLAPPLATPVSPTDSPATSLPPAPVAPAAPWVHETTLTISTYGYELGFEPTQPDDPIYPYPRLNFDLVGPPTPKNYQAVVLENGYVSLTILPELGGRIYRWVDKATGRQLLYENPVVKPTNWGYRGWWLAAGGIEWAFPVDEHGLNEWRPWSYSIGHTSSGLAVTVSNVEDRSGMEVGATITLDANHAYVILEPWANNNTSEAQQYQLWLNAMLTLGGNSVSGQTQFIIPANQVTVHSTSDGGLPGPGSGMDWPTHGGRDMSWYQNWGGHLGFFAPVVSTGFVGLYDHSADQGIVRAFNPGWPAGSKFFGPAGISPAQWTDDGSNYVELWSGATGSFWAYNTLNPGESVGWTERWYPVSGLGGFNHANASAALRLTDTGGGAEIGVAVSALTSGRVSLWVGGQLAQEWPLSLYPGQAFISTWSRPAGIEGALGLRLQDSNGIVIAQTGQTPQDK